MLETRILGGVLLLVILGAKKEKIAQRRWCLIENASLEAWGCDLHFVAHKAEDGTVRDFARLAGSCAGRSDMMAFLCFSSPDNHI